MEFTEEKEENGRMPVMEAEANATGKFNKETVRRIAETGKEKLGTFGKLLNKRNLILAVVILVVLVGGVLTLRYATNNYMTPIHKLEKMESWKKGNSTKVFQESLENMGVTNSKELFKAMAKSEILEELLEDWDESMEASIENTMDKYGDDFKVTYKLLDKTQLKKSELRDYKKELRNSFSSLESLADQTKNFDSDDWEDMAEELEMTKGQTKNLIAALKELTDDVSHIDVTDGYELELTRITTGSELDEPEEKDVTVVVLKINGKWASYTMTSVARNFGYGLWSDIY